jgi:hypothetical protein
MPAVELTDTLDGGVMMEWDNGVLRISTNEYDLGKDVGYCPARELVSAFDKLVKGGELSFLEEYSIEALYHENLHPESKGIVKILKNSYQEKIQETCTQLYAREKYGKILRLGYGREPSHFEEIRTEGLGYKENCNLLRDLFSKDGKIQVGELINIVNESQDGLIIVTEKLKWYSRRQIKEFLDQLR